MSAKKSPLYFPGPMFLEQAKTLFTRLKMFLEKSVVIYFKVCYGELVMYVC